jgi:hypothetical protein
MTPFDALRCATSEAARFMGESDRWGTLAVGKRADLVLVRANPLADVAATRDIEAVFVNGYYLTRADLDSLLEQRAALVSRPPRIAATDLALSLHSDGNLVEQGSWRERIVGADFGQLSFRHHRLPDGGWLVEERHAGADPRRHPERRTSRLVLAPDLTISRGEYDVESFVGRETGELSWSETTGYRVQYRAVDGYTSETALPGPRLVPSERMALSFVPRLIASAGASAVVALDAQANTLSTAEMTLTAVPNETAEPAWELNVSRIGERVKQTYHLRPDGGLDHLEEMLPLLWPRELVPIEDQVPAG